MNAVNRSVTLATFAALSACGLLPARSSDAQQDAPSAQRHAPPANASLRQQLDDYVSRISAFGFSGALLVVRGDDVLVRKGCGFADREKRTPNTPQTLFDIGSVTKPFPATAIVQLESAGRLSVQDPISKHFGSVPDDKAAITIHHLLTHTSGLPRGVQISGAATENRREAVRQMLALPLDFKPGERWGYSNTGYQLLAGLIEEITGERFEEHMKRHIFRPAGMMHTGFIRDSEIAGEPVAVGYSPRYPRGVVGRADQQWYHWGLRGCGGVLTSIEDLYHWEQALRGESLLSKAGKEKLFTPHQRSYREGSYYGYGWDIADDFLDVRTRFVGHGGDTRGFECKLYRFPNEGVVIAVVSNTNDHHCWWIPHHIFSILFGRQYTLPPVVVTLEADTLKRWEGDYQGQDGAALALRVHDEQLRVTPIGQTVMELLVPPSGAAPARVPEGSIAADEANRRADAAIRAWVEKDLKKLDTLLDPQWLNWPQRLSDWLDREAAQRGGFKEHRALGTSRGRMGRPRTCVELRFESATELAVLRWNGERITHFDFPSASGPRLRFAPESETRFNAFDIASSRTTTLEFVVGAPGTRVLLRAPDGRTMEFTRPGARQAAEGNGK